MRPETIQSSLTLQIPMSTINMQLQEPLTDLYLYMDFIHQKVMVFYNEERKINLNIEKLAKKRLNIKKFWQEIRDVKLKITKDKETLEIIYEMES